nr:MAG TPA: Large subunit terminase [Caudoviricetes sp.]
MLEPLRHIRNPQFGVVIFRRNSGQITNEGGLWDNAKSIYRALGATFLKSAPKQVIFPSGAKITFNHLHSDDSVYGYQGAQIPLICFDELTHFTEAQFVYMMSRNRSTCGVHPYIRATCNPDSDSWVARFIEWWIDQDTGYAIPERSGVIRYFIRLDGEIRWGDTRDELAAKYHVAPELCKSATFISSSIFDNKVLLNADPGYLATLNALSLVEKERLLRGNWKIRPAAGLYFKRDMFRIVRGIPDKIVSIARAWDLAATVITPNRPDPDRTASCLMARMRNGQYIILDVQRRALSAADVRKLMVNTAKADRTQYPNVRITVPQDPGQAGKAQAASMAALLAGYSMATHPVTGSKITRAEPFAAQAQHGSVMVLEGGWNEAFFSELEGFPDALHDDQVDAASDAFNAVAITADWGALIS